jgi:hypothetical protein
MRAAFIFLSLFLAFHLAFWQQGLGINLPIFTSLICLLIYLRKKPRLTATHWFLIACNILSGTGLILFHTDLSVVIALISGISLAGSLHQASSSVVESLFNGLLNAFNKHEGLIPGTTLSPLWKQKRGYLYLRVAALPLVVVFLYLALFAGGNAIFHEITGGFFRTLRRLLEQWSAAHFFFVLLGLFIVRWATKNNWSTYLKLPLSNRLKRRKSRASAHHPLSLRIEYYRAMVLFISLNLLFAVVNFIDVKWVWFGFSLQNGFDLKAFVHEGTAYLLTSLLLSIGLVLYFFRGNLNFYPNAKWLKRFAYLWIAQNVVLAISVLVRTAHYIGFHGLASKRIGLLLFTAMVIFGLYTLVIKIAQQRNFAYLLRWNSAFIIGTLALNACLPWNRIVATHNLKHGNAHEIDVDNYLALDPSAYPLLYAHLDVIEHQIEAHQHNKVRWISYTKLCSFQEKLERLSIKYLSEEKQQTFWSWNWADARARRQLKALSSI